MKKARAGKKRAKVQDNRSKATPQMIKTEKIAT